MKLSELVEKYIDLRDKKAQLEADHQAKVAKIDGVLEKIESALLKTFDSAGLDSAKTPAGTAYVTTKATASVADPDVFRTFIKENEAWELIQTRCSKTGVEQYKAVNGDVPPGVNWREERVVNVRRPS